MKNEIITDDVIRRLARGYEPTQTKISMDALKDVLKPHQLRNILGGSGICDEYGPNLCNVECNDGTKACASTCEVAKERCGGGGHISCVCPTTTL